MGDSNKTEERLREQDWDFAGWGTVRRIDFDEIDLPEKNSEDRPKLSELKATAICGNDITSSCLYVVALSTFYAGKFAPLVLLGVAWILHLYRKIYTEVGGALPFNGGAYNVLLNTTTKSKAAFAASLTFLSYIATAVISSNEAMHYAHNFLPFINVIWATIVVLAIFAGLNLIGLRESSKVAVGIFIFHLSSLFLLSAFCIFTLMYGDINFFAHNWLMEQPRGLIKSLYFGFGAAMLGISGFESSSNFIEEQDKGVFPKTLRNMWVSVSIFNPLLSILTLGLISLSSIGEHKQDLLAQLGLIAGGPWLKYLISLDAVLVLSGAVLTSYVGVIGLVERMALDRCVPRFFLRRNKKYKTNHWIILSFFALCSSILLVTKGRIELLAGVYTLAFLGVMLLMASGNLMLKLKRSNLLKDSIAPTSGVFLAILGVIIGISANILLSPENVQIFMIYFGVTLFVVSIMFLRVSILKLFINIFEYIHFVPKPVLGSIRHFLYTLLDKINSNQMVFFTDGDHPEKLNAAARYVLDNEQTKYLKVVHCFENEEDIPQKLESNLNTIDQIYPELRIDVILCKIPFNAQGIDCLSQHMDIPKNYMFIGSPGKTSEHNISEFGGVRVIM
jgi:amino acid transporter